jgi:hypothetical protein
MDNEADSENNTKAETINTIDSHLIGPRQEYRRTGKAPDASDAMVHDEDGEGKPTTPFRW